MYQGILLATPLRGAEESGREGERGALAPCFVRDEWRAEAVLAPLFPRSRSKGRMAKKETAMTSVTVEPSVQTILAALTEKTELRDAAGSVIGYFTPWKVAEDEM